MPSIEDKLPKLKLSREHLLKIAQKLHESRDSYFTRTNILKLRNDADDVNSANDEATRTLLTEQLRSLSATASMVGLKDSLVYGLDTILWGLLVNSAPLQQRFSVKFSSVNTIKGDDAGKSGTAEAILSANELITGFSDKTTVSVRFPGTTDYTGMYLPGLLKEYSLDELEFVNKGPGFLKLLKMPFNEFQLYTTSEISKILSERKNEINGLEADKERIVSAEIANRVACYLLNCFNIQIPVQKAKRVKSQYELEEFIDSAKLTLDEKLAKEYNAFQKRVSAIKRKALTRPSQLPDYYCCLALEVYKHLTENSPVSDFYSPGWVGSYKLYKQWIKSLNSLIDSQGFKQIENNAKKECIEHIVEHEIKHARSTILDKVYPDCNAEKADIKQASLAWLNKIRSDEEYDVKRLFASKIDSAIGKLTPISSALDTPMIDILEMDSGSLAEKLVNHVVDEASHNLIDKAVEKVNSDSFIRALVEAKLIEKSDAEKEESYLPLPRTVKKFIAEKRVKDRETFYSELKAIQIDITPLEMVDYFYSPNSQRILKGKELEPYGIGMMFLNDLLTAAQTYASNERHKSLVELAAKIIHEKTLPEQKEFTKCLSKLNKDIFLRLAAELANFNAGTNPSHQFRVYDFKALSEGKFSPAILPETKIGRAVKGSELYLAYRDMAASELIGILEASKEGRGAYERFRVFWERYYPFEYDLPQHFKAEELKRVYRFYLTKNPATLERASDNCGACLTINNAKELTADFGTINLIVTHGRESKGYMRFFIAKTDKGEAALAWDNIEIGQKEFDKNVDSVRAMGLAAIQLGLDMNIKYILACDGRMGYGIRAAFGSKYMKTTLEKFGAPADFSYTFNFGEYDNQNQFCPNRWKGSAGVVLQNWRC